MLLQGQDRRLWWSPAGSRHCPGRRENVGLEAGLSTAAVGVVEMNKRDYRISNKINTRFDK